MFTILASWLFVFAYAARLKIHRKKAFWTVLFVAFFLAYLSWVEVIILLPDNPYSRLDEAYFKRIAELEFSDVLAEGNRYIGFHLYNFITYNTLFEWEWSLKVHLIAFGMLIMLVLYDATKNIYAIWLFPLVFSYVIVLSTLNMRDVIILFITLFSLLALSRAKTRRVLFWVFFPTLILLVLRPQAAVLFFLVAAWAATVTRGFNNPLIVYFAPAAMIGAIIISERLFQEVLVYVAPYAFVNPEFYMQGRASELGQIPFLGENGTAVVRQLITPLPTSKIGEIISGDMSQNLYLYEVSRSIMMMCLYVLVGYLLFNHKYVVRAFRVNKFLGLLLLLAALYTITYAIYSDGGGDSRNKLYPFFLIYSLSICIHKVKTTSRLRKIRRLNSNVVSGSS